MYPNETGGVKPFCGEITISTKDVDPALVPGRRRAWISPRRVITIGWLECSSTRNTQLLAFARDACTSRPSRRIGPTFREKAATGQPTHPGKTADCDQLNSTFGPNDSSEKLPPDDWKATQINTEWTNVDTFVEQAYNSELTNPAAATFSVTADVINRGWGGAGIWYNQIAQWNGAMFSIIRTLPVPDMMPDVMGKVEQARKNDETLDSDERYEPNIHQPKGNGQSIAFDLPGEEMIARELNDVYKYFSVTKSTDLRRSQRRRATSCIASCVSVLGTDGIFNLRQNDGVNPLAQLVAIGKSMIDAALRDLLATFAFSFGGSMFAAMERRRSPASCQRHDPMGVGFRHLRPEHGIHALLCIALHAFRIFLFCRRLVGKGDIRGHGWRSLVGHGAPED